MANLGQHLWVLRARDYWAWPALVLLRFAQFLPALIFIGMEHTLEAGVVIVALLCLDPIARGEAPDQSYAYVCDLGVGATGVHGMPSDTGRRPWQ